jgi:hypothetical protein
MARTNEQKAQKVWVLTYEVNDYDQHGRYFEAAFAQHPSLKTLADYFSANTVRANLGGPMEAVSFLEHLRAGGGRRALEDTWYNLDEEPLL